MSVTTDRRQGVNSSNAVKTPCVAATTANITLSGLQTIDGVAVTAGQRVLVKNQTSGVDNGIYTADTGSWSRDLDFDGTYDVVQGTLVYVNGGSTNQGFWYVTTADPITPGTTSLAFAQAFAAVGTPLTIAQFQNQNSVYVGTVGGTTDAITLTPATAIASYVAGQRFCFLSAGNNTINVTVNISGQGAKAITKFGNTPLVANDMPAAGVMVEIEYDGTQFQLRGFIATGTSGHTVPMLDQNNTWSGTQTMNGKSIWEAECADVASASSCNIWAGDGNTVHITGTATINDFGTAPQAGARMHVIASGAFILKNSATIDCQGGADITAASGDSFDVYAETTTTFRVRSYSRGAATPSTSTTSFGILKFGTVNIAQNSTKYLGAVGTTAGAAAQKTYVAEPTDITELRVNLSAAVAGGNSIVFTIQKNGVDTALTCTVGAGATSASDTTDTVKFDPGDYLSLKAVTSATFGNTTDIGATVVTRLSGTTYGANLALSWFAANTTNVYSAGEANGSAPTATEAKCEVPLPAGYLRSHILYEWVTGGIFAPRRNAASIGNLLTTAVYPAATGQDLRPKYWTANDLYNLRNTDSGTTGNDGGAVIFTDTMYGINNTMFTLFTSLDQAQNTTVYMGGYAAAGASATETDVQIPMPACTIKNLRLAASAAPPAGQNCTITLRKNGADTGLTATITSAGRTATDTTHSVTFAAGDTLSLKCVPSVTAGTLSYNACIEITP